VFSLRCGGKGRLWPGSSAMAFIAAAIASTPTTGATTPQRRPSTTSGIAPASVTVMGLHTVAAGPVPLAELPDENLRTAGA